MVSFTNYFNAILLTGSRQKLKLKKIQGTLIISLLCKSEFSSATKTFLFLLKTTTREQVTGRKTPTKSCFKDNARTSSKNSTTLEMLEFQSWKKTANLIQKRKLQTRNYINNLKPMRWTLSVRKQTSKWS